MAALIEDNQIAWKGETPWHGLGVKVPDNATGVEMLKQAGLDWKVERRTLAMQNPKWDRYDPNNPLNGPKALIAPLKEFKAIVRSDTQEVFQVASHRYEIVQNEEIVNFYREFCEAGHATMDVVGALHGGSKIWALAKLNQANKDLGGGDILAAYLLILTAHDGTSATIGKPTQTRVVCNNTLQVALGEKAQAEVRIRHNRKWTPELRESAQQVLKVAGERVQAMNEVAAAFAKIRVDGKGKVDFLRKLLNLDKEAPKPDAFDPSTVSQADMDRVVSGLVDGLTDEDVKNLGRVGQNILEAVYSSPGHDMVTADGTLWGVLNGVTYYVDHQRGRNQDNRLSGAWIGAGANLKDKAVEVGMEMAGIKL